MAVLFQLDELMKDNEKVELLGPCIDHLFSMCCMQVHIFLQRCSLLQQERYIQRVRYTQYRYVLHTKMKMDNANGKEVMRLLQYLTMVLMSMYSHRDLVKQATMQVADSHFCW